MPTPRANGNERCFVSRLASPNLTKATLDLNEVEADYPGRDCIPPLDALGAVEPPRNAEVTPNSPLP